MVKTEGYARALLRYAFGSSWRKHVVTVLARTIIETVQKTLRSVCGRDPQLSFPPLPR
jgi:hypothetical protein